MSFEPCPTCEGCGRVSDTDNPEPWSRWLALPPGSNLAVVMGLVKPKECPSCDGTGGNRELRRASVTSPGGARKAVPS
jgi:DnaJ-class molecular chaperone